jgi:hypothetical protein
MTYDSVGLNLIAQGIAKVRYWDYEDTGGESVATFVGAGWFSDGYDKGMRVGDNVLIRDLTNTIQYEAVVSVAQDTGDTQVTVVLDTG